MESNFPWHLFNNIGVFSESVQTQVNQALLNQEHKPLVTVEKNWYF